MEAMSVLIIVVPPSAPQRNARPGPGCKRYTPGVSEPGPDPIPAGLRDRIQDDAWARALGVEFLELTPGHCRVALRLQPHMLNFQGAPHGGVIFSLADVAFSAACNSQGAAAVALSMTIGFLSPAAPGSRLVAEARERRQGRRAGFYEVAVTNAQGALVATVHCVAHRVGGEA
jgi:acyl-CoA thioesterase